MELENLKGDPSLEQSSNVATYSSSLEGPADTTVTRTLASSNSQSLFRYNKLAVTISLISLLVIALIGGGSILLLSNKGSKNPSSANSAGSSDNYAVSSLPLQGLKSDTQLQVGEADHLSVNGQLKVSNTLVVSPTATPTSPVTGQIYYDQKTNQPYYYDGTAFVSLAPTAVPQHVTSLGGVSGAISVGNGLQVTSGQLGLSSTITQKLGQSSGSGVSSLTAGTSNLVITNNGNGSYTLSDNSVVNSGSSGQIALITGAQTIGGSILSQSGSSLTAAGSLTVSGGLLTNSLQQTAAGNNIAISAGSDSIVFTDGSRTFTFPAGGGANQTICTTGVSCAAGGGIAVLLQPGAAQVDTGAGSSIFVNNTGGGNLLELQGAGSDRFVVTNGGNVTVGGTLTLGSALSVANGGTGAVSLTANGVLYGNGGGAIQATAAAANSILATNGSSVPGLTQTLPIAVQSNITTTGILATGSIASGFGTISTSNNITTTAALQGGTLSVASGSFTVDSSGNIVTTGTATIQGAGGLSIGVAGTTAGSLVFANASNGRLTTLQGLAPAGQNQTITIPASSAATDTVCLLTLANCVGAGGGVTASGGTQNFVPKFTNAGGTQLGNSLIFDNGTSVGVNNSSPGASFKLDVGGNVNISGSTVVGTGLTVTSGGATVSAGGITVTGNSTIAGTLTSLTGLTSSGTITFSGLSTAGVVHNSAAGVLSTGLVALGTDTSGNYVGSIGSATGLTLGGTNGVAGAVPTLAVNYGALANTAVQGNTTLVCPTGTGNLTGGGNTITLGSGGSCNNLTVVNSPTFTGTLSVQGGGGISIGVPSTTDGTLVFNNASNAHTTTLKGLAAAGQNQTITLPASSATTDTVCLLTLANCVGTGGGVAGSGTSGDIAVFTGTNSVGNSILSQSGAALTLTGTLTESGALTVQSGGANITGNSTITGTLTGLTGLTSSGTITFSGLSTAGVVHNSAAGVLSTGLVALGTDTSGNYVASLGSVTGLTISGTNGVAGAVPTLSVAYGSAANTAVQGNTTLVCPSGTGNLTGGGNTITLGSGGSCNGLDVVSSPTFSGNLAVQGATGVTIGSTTNNGALSFLDGTSDGFTGTIKLNGAIAANKTYTLPATSGATDEICLKTLANCAGSGGGVTTSSVGTNGTIAMFTGSSTIANSILTQSGTTLTDGGNLVVNAGSGFTGNLIDLQVNSSSKLSVDQTGALTVAGSITANTLQHSGAGNNLALSAGADSIVFTDGSRTFTFPAGGGANQTICTTGVTCASGGGVAVLLQPGTVQADTGSGSSIFINNTGGGNLVELQGSGSDEFVVANNGNATVGGTLTVKGASATIGTTTVQGSLVLNDGNGASNKTATLKSAATLGQNTIYNLPDPGAGTVDICLSTGNCAGSGGGLTGSGTTGALAVFNGTGSLTSSASLTESGSTVTSSGNLVIQGTNSLTLGTAGPAGNTGSIIFQNATNAHTVTLQSGAPAASFTLTLPTTAGNNGDCLESNGSGTLSFQSCTGGAGGGVTSVDSQTGILSLSNSTGSGGVITIDNAKADGSTEGIATFNSTNFQDNGSGTINTIQDIATTSSPTFSALTLQASTTGLALTGTPVAGTGATALLQLGNAISSGNSAANGGTYIGINEPNTGAGSAADFFNFEHNGTSELKLSSAGALTEAGALTIQSGGANITGGLTAAGTITFSGLNSTGVVHTNGSGVLSTGLVALGTDTSGNYLASLGSVTGLTLGGTNGVAGGVPTLSVAYGSSASTAVQGNTTLVCPTGTGNLTGGGNTITLGSGGSCSGITIVNSPTFSGNLAVQGATGVTIGSTTNNGVLSFLDGTSDGFTGTIQLGGAIGANKVYNLPTTSGASDTICLLTLANCVGTGGGVATTGGSQNFITKYNNAGATQITNSQLFDNGTNVGLNVSGGFGTVARFTVNGNVTADNAATTQLNTGAAANKGLVVQGFGTGATPNQTADLIQLQDSTGAVLAKFDSTGKLTAAGGTFTNLGTGIVHANGSGVLSSSAVVLGTETSGNYLDHLGTVTGLTLGGTNNVAGGVPTLSVAYGSSANTAVQGNVTVTCPTGTGNLNGGGDVITLGSGGSCSNITITNSPTFSGTVAVQGAGGITVGVAGTTDGALVLANASNSHLTTLKAAASASQDQTITIPASTATTDTVCLETLANCVGTGGGVAGSGTSGTIAVFTGTNSVGNSILSQSGTTLTVAGNQVVNAGSGFSGNLIDLQVNSSSKLSVDQGGNLTGGLINGQTISSAASFTGTLAVTTLGAATGSNYLCYNASNQIASCNTTGSSGVAFVQGGNSFGATAVLGTTDANSLSIGTYNGTALQQRIGITNTTSSGNNAALSFSGTSVFKPTADSTTIFQIQNATTGTLLNADTSNMRLGVDVTYSPMTTPSGLAVGAPTSGGSLAASTTYFYEVTAIGGAGGETVVSNEASGATDGSGDQTLPLTWTAVTGASGYRVYRSTTSGSEVFLTSVLTNSFTDSGSLAVSTATPPVTANAYVATNVSNNSLQLSVGGNGTPTGQVYVSGTVPSGPLSTTTIAAGSRSYGVAVEGNYTYILNNIGNTMQVFDTSNPASPQLITTVATGVHPFEIHIQGHYAYVINNQGTHTMQVFDISNPASPTIAGTVTLGSIPVYFAIEGNYAYIITGGSLLQVVNISNPNSPVLLSQFTRLGTTADDIVVQGRYAYAVGMPGWLESIDISNPASPVIITSVSTGGAGAVQSKLTVQGRYAYVLEQDGTTNADLAIFDISNPASLVKVSSVSTGNSGSSQGYVVSVQGRYAYVDNYGLSQLQVFDVSNPANPWLVGSVPTATNPASMVIQGRYAYMADFGIATSTFQIFDLGGTYTQTLQAGSAQVGSLQVDSNTNIGGNATIQGGLGIANGLQVAGPVGVSGSLTLSPTSLATPAAPTLTSSGTGGTLAAATYFYQLAAISTTATTQAVAANPASVTTSGTTSANTLTWSGVSGATGYIVYRSTNGTTWFSNVVSSTTTSITDDGSTYSWTSSATPLTITNAGGNLTVGGQAVFQNATNSVSAFQIQNASAGSLLNVDTVNGNITLLGNNSGELQAWQSTTAISSTINTDPLIANGYIYIAGANASSGNTYTAKINANGSVGTWNTSTTLPNPVNHAVEVMVNGYAYVIGGQGPGASFTKQSTVQYAKVNPDGTFGSWAFTTAMPDCKYSTAPAVINGYIYVIAGPGNNCGSTVTGKVFVAKPNSDGTISNWNITTTLPDTQDSPASAAANGYIYVIGGKDGGTNATINNTVYYTKPNSDGSLTSWSTGNNTGLPARQTAKSVVMNGYIYIIGGLDNTGTASSSVYYAKINNDGTLGNWTQEANSLPAANWYTSVAAANGYVYSIGGQSNSNVVYYASGQRVQVGGSLDLVGLAGGSLGDGTESLGTGSTGGQLTAGNTDIVGTLQVEGDANFSQNVSIANGLSVKNGLTIAGLQGTSSYLQVQNTDGVNVLSVSTVNLIGNSSFESGSSGGTPSGWSARGAGVPTISSSQALYGSNSMSVATTTAANDGAKYAVVMPAVTGTYTVSGYAKVASGSITDYAMGAATTYITGTISQTASATVVGSGTTFTNTMVGGTLVYGDGTTDTITGFTDATHITVSTSRTHASSAYTITYENTCLSGQTVTTTWTRFSCSFNTTKGTAAFGTYIFVEKTGASAETFFVDGVQLESSASATNYRESDISLNGQVTAKNSADSTTAFQIQNAAGTTLFDTDTVNQYVGIGTAAPGSKLDIQGSLTAASPQLLNVNATTTVATTGVYGSQTILTVTASAATSQFYYGSSSSAFSTNTNTSANGNVVGVQGQAGAENGGNVKNAYAGYFGLININTGGGGATIQNGAGVYVPAAATVGGSNVFTNITGVMVANQSGATNNTNLLLGTTTVPTGNFSIYNASTYNNYLGGATTIQTGTTNSTTGFQIQNASAATVLNVDTTASNNLITNGDFEGAKVTGWSAKGSAGAPVQTSAQQWQGNNALSETTTAAIGDGVKYIYSNALLTNGQQYTLSFYVKLSAGTWTNANMAVGRADDGSTDTVCTVAPVSDPSTASWTRYSCTFTAGAQSGSPYIFIKQLDAVVRTFFIDGVQLQTGNFASGFNAGGAIQLSGIVNSPVVFQNKVDSSTAFQVQGVNGLSYISLNTLAGSLTLGNSTGGASTSILGGSAGINIGSGGIANTIQIGNTVGAVAQTINIGNNGTAGSTNTVVIGSTVGTSPLTLQGGTGNINLNPSGSSNTGVLVKPGTDSTAAFKIQNAGGTTNVLNVDTTNTSIGIAGASTTAGYALNVTGPVATSDKYYAGNGVVLGTTASTTTGAVYKVVNAGPGGVTGFDVVVMNASGQAVDTTTARDPRVYGVAIGNYTNGNPGNFAISGNTTISVTAAAVNIGDQLVTSTVAGQAMVDNNATSGIIGYALTSKAAGSAGTVSVFIRPHNGVSTPDFRPTADSATAFQIQNAASTETLFTADTTARSASGGNLLKVGNSTGTDTATTILQVDAASSDPTSNLSALNGGLYYNSTTNHLMVIENGIAKQVCNMTDLGCGSTTTGAAFVQNGNSFGAAAVLGTTDANTLTLGTYNGTALQQRINITNTAASGNNATLTFNGASVFKPTADSATAFRVQDANSNNYIQADTSGANLYLGNTGIASTVQIGNTTGAVTQGINIGTNSTASSTTNVTLGSTVAGTTVIQNSSQINLNAGTIATNATNLTLFNAVPTTVAAFGAATSLTLGGTTTTNTINLGNGTIAAGNTETVNIATSSTSTGKTNVTIGSTNDGSTLTLQSGTGNLNLNPSGASNTGVVVKPGADSTAAFLIQNASGGSLFNVDSTGSNLTINGADNGQVQAWQTGSSTNLGGRASASAVVANGFIYEIGGLNSGGTGQNTVQFAKLGANGNLTAPTACGVNTWCTTTALPTNVVDGSAVYANGYIYVTAGDTNNTNGTSQNTVYYGKVNQDGTISKWNTNANAITQARNGAESIVYNGYLYVIGGLNTSGTTQNTVYYAKLNADGSTGLWSSTNTLSAAVDSASVGVANGYVYVVGGGAAATAVQYAKLNTDGTTSTWATSTVLPNGRKGAGIAINNGYLYIIGGYNNSSTFYANTFYAPLNSATGTVGAWSCQGSAGDCTGVTPVNGTALPATRSFFGETPVSTNGYIYVISGTNASVGTTVYYTSTARTQIAGSLDLVGLTGQNLSEGGSGGQLTAGNTGIIGTLNVQNAATFNQSLAVGGTLTVGGDTAIVSSTNSTTAFQVQNTSNVALLSADTSNMRVSIGTGGTAVGQLYIAGTQPTSVFNNSITGNGVTQTVINGRYAYVSDYWNSQIKIYDVSNPGSPAQIGSALALGGGLPISLTLAGHYLYIAENTGSKLQIVDVSNPNAPSITGTVTTTNGSNSVAVVGHYAYVGQDAGNGVDVIDVVNPAKPVKIANIAAGGRSGQAMMAYGRYVYVLTANNGTNAQMQTIDTTTNTVVGTYTLSGGASGNSICNSIFSPSSIYVQGRYAFVANCGNNAIDVFDVSNPTASGAAPVKTLSTTGLGATVGPMGLVVQGRLLYAGLPTAGATPSYLATYDISTISSMSQVGTALSLGAGSVATGMTASGRYLYLSDHGNGVVDIFDMGGTYSQQLMAGGIEASTLQINSDANIAGNTDLTGSLQVGQSAQVSGSLGVNGTATFANTTNSTTAFQIQNATNGSLFNVDSSNNVITLNGNNSGETAAWQTDTSTLPAPRSDDAVVTANGYIYVVGGINATSATALSTVMIGKVNADGSINNWKCQGQNSIGVNTDYCGAGATIANTNTLPTAVGDESVVVLNGYIYAVGGLNGSGIQITTVQRAKLNADGTTGAWVTTDTGLPQTRADAAAAVYNGVIYMLGGSSTTGAANSTSTLYYAKPGANGAISSWTTQNNIVPPGSGHATTEDQMVVDNGYMYVMGTDDNNVAIRDVWYSRINADGSLAGFNIQSNGLPTNATEGLSVAANGYIYTIGGQSGGTTSTETASVYYMKPGNNGTPTTWSTSANTLPGGTKRGWMGAQGITVNGYIYAIGGEDTSGTATNTIYRTSLSRIQVGGSLDLVGINGQNLTDGSSGGELTAGNTNIVGTLQATGNASFLQNVGINGNLSVQGDAYIGATLTVAGNVTLTTGVVISGVADGATAIAHTLNTSVSYATSGDLLLAVENNGVKEFSIDRGGHIVTGGSAPTATKTAAAGSTATCTVSGTDTAGTITIVPNGTGITTGDLCTITFATTFANAPVVVVAPGGANGANTSNLAPFTDNAATSSFKVGALFAPSSGVTYTFTYIVAQ